MGKAATAHRARRQNKFHRPVVVQPGRIDRDRVITTVTGAADILLHQWPPARSDAWVKALKACIAVLKSDKPPRYARKAFIEAAQEARIFLGENS